MQVKLDKLVRQLFSSLHEAGSFHMQICALQRAQEGNLPGHHARLYLQGVGYESLLCCKFAGCLGYSLDVRKVC